MHLLYRCHLIVFILFCMITAKAEGTLELEPTTRAGYTTKFQIGSDRVSNIATFSSPPDKRLYIHIKDPANEKIYLGFGAIFDADDKTDIGTLNCSFRVKDANGKIIYPTTGISSPLPKAGTGFINTRLEAVSGPNTLNGGGAGYTPLVVNPTAGVSGDYYIEFSRSNTVTDSSRLRFEYIDFTVGNQTTNDAIKGRLWSKVWSLVSLYINGNPGRSESKFYTYTTDSVVTSFNMNGMQPIGFGVMCNERGTNSSPNFLQSRNSIKTMAGTQGVNRAYPQFKIFLNDPDIKVYPSFITKLFLKFAFYNGCDTKQTCQGITVDVTKNANAEILLDLNTIVGYQPNTEDIFITAKLLAGTNCVPWNGRDGKGNKIASNKTVQMFIKISNGLTNFPIFDPEINDIGLIVNSIRPENPGAILPVFWDDTNVPNPGATSNLTGCTNVNGCHTWTNNFGDNVTMNSWWYGSELNDQITLLIDPYPTSLAYAGPDQFPCTTKENGINIGSNLGADPKYKYTWKPLPTKATIDALVDVTKQQTQLNLSTISGLNSNDSLSYELLVDNLGCIRRDTVKIYIRGVGGIQVFGKTNVCPNSKSVVYWINKRPDITSIVWDNFVNSSQSSKIALSTDTVYVDFSATAPTTASFKVNATSNCPISSFTKQVNIISGPKADPPIGKNKLCFKTENVQVYKVTPVAGSTYQWFVEGGKGIITNPLNGDPTQARITWNSTIVFPNSTLGGKVWVQQVYTLPDLTTCTGDTAALTVLAYDPIVGTPLFDTAICTGTELQLSYPEFSSNPTSAKYIWQPTIGFTNSNSTDIYNPRIKLITVDGDTIAYNITVLKDGCVHRDTFKVAIRPDARIENITGPNPTCINSTALYAVKDTFSLSRTWRVRDTLVAPYTPTTNTNGKTVTIKWGKYSNNAYVAVESKSKFGCKSARDTLQIDKIFFKNYKPKYDSVLCKTPKFTWGFRTGGDNGGNIYNWKFEHQDGTPTSSPVLLGKGDTINATFTKVGQYYLTVKQSGADYGDGCYYYPDTLKIDVFDEADIKASDDTTICHKDTATLYVVNNRTIPFKWYAQTAPNAETLTAEYKVSPTGPNKQYTYWVKLANPDCKAVDTVKVTVNPLPAPPLNKKDLEFCFEDNAILTLDGPPGLSKYEWKPMNEATPSVDIAYSIFTDDLQKQYVSLKVTDANKCSNKDSVLLKTICDPRLELPKVFSPNDDGYNDSMQVFGAHFQNYKLRIFNRWGEVMFESQDRYKVWDGTYKGEPVPEGVFPWTVSYKSLRGKESKNTIEKNGSITVVR